MITSHDDNPWVHRLAVLVAAACLFMIVAGGMVTSMKAGDAVPDWPLSYGSLLPPMVGNIFWEHGHRLVGMTLGLLTIVLTVVLARRESRRGVRRLGYIALPAVCVQGALGGFRVKIVSSEALQNVLFANPTGADVEHLRVAVAIIHTASAQLIFCLMATIAVVTSRRWRAAAQPLRAPQTRKLRILCLATVALVFVQVLLGALRRQTGGTVVWHAIGAVLVAFHVGLITRRVLAGFTQVKPLVRSAAVLLCLTALQLVFGVVSWLLTSPALGPAHALPQIMGSAELASAIRSAHVALGAGLLAYCVVLTLRCYRHVAEDVSQEAAAAALAEKGVAPA